MKASVLDTGICECGNACKHVPCKNNPNASELYCEKCHRSYLLNGKEHRTQEQIQKHEALASKN